MLPFNKLTALAGLWAGVSCGLPLGAQSGSGDPDPAAALVAKGDLAGAKAALERVVEVDASNREAWVRLATLRLSSGEARPAAEAYEHALALKRDPLTMYDAGCAYARLGEVDKAFTWLEAAAQGGGLSRRQFEQDADLASLRGDARFAALLDQATRASEPCRSQPESSQFDFWVGEWNVHPAGAARRVGRNRIEKILAGCVLLENWTDANGRAGKSFNAYDRARQRWEQTWVDQSGTITHFVDGEYRDGAMRFRTEPREQNGERIERRLTFYNLGPDRVRQHSQRSKDGGRTWQDDYDFIYERAK